MTAAGRPEGRLRLRRPPRPLRPRVALAGFCTGFLVVAVFGFAPYRASTDEARACATDGELTIATGSDVSTGSFRRDLIEEWNRREGAMKAKLVEISSSTDEERAEMAAAAQSQSCAYDILVLDVAWTAEFARNGHLRPVALDAGRSAAFLDKPLDSTEVDGVRYALPFATDAPLLFRQAGLPLPTAPGQLVRLAAEHGYAGQFDDYEGGTVNLLEAVLSGGAEVMEGDRVVLDAPENAGKAKGALTAWHAMLSRQTWTDGARSLREESSLQGFRSRRAGYLRNWPFAFHRLASDPSMRDGKNLRFAMSALPGPGVLGGFNLAVTRRSPDHEQAERLIAFLTTAEAQKKLFACGGYPPVVESVYDDYRAEPGAGASGAGGAGPEETGATASGPRTCRELLAAGGLRPAGPDPGTEITSGQLALFADAIRRAVQDTRPRPPVAHYATFSEVFRSCLRQVTSGALSPDDLDFPRYADALRGALDGRRPEGDPCRRSSEQ
ncbi:extracellular solute-binding protein [Planomonospora parontospora]|uniref:extracellular solute-binding protein n=1 Tax=Planomonospora parontospora TaxID=58119 RepID=UPI0019C2EA86|nr:extracellular solute-binding protein [Planomonospora parontospora]GGL02795.1 hypothetical protein GCM10014719_01200 [Planomonospora parontospora subsp. antibiotica]GII13280.1 hypothetical protein Ppa05_00060 [Planomonospora parontospora subsp. antibiotica]